MMPIDLPPTEYPHTWCNWLSDRGEIGFTLLTRDDWAYASWIRVESDGAHVHFFKRTAPSTMQCFGGFVEGLEKTEELFAKYGVDIPGWAAWIKRYGIVAQNDGGEADHETEANGILIGGQPGPLFWRVERWYAEHAAAA